MKINGRERGIRTPGGITLTGFQDRHVQPLRHLPTFVKSEILSKKDKSYLIMEEPAGLEPANGSFAGCSLTNLAIAPSYNILSDRPSKKQTLERLVARAFC